MARFRPAQTKIIGWLIPLDANYRRVRQLTAGSWLVLAAGNSGFAVEQARRVTRCG
jgi:hypothetical protein